MSLDVRDMKRQLKTLVDDRIAKGGAVADTPVPRTDWWLQWERHQWLPVVVLWDATHPFVLPAPPSPPKVMQVTFSPQGPFRRGQTVAFTIAAKDQAAPNGPDLLAQVSLDDAPQGTTGAGQITLTLAWHEEDQEVAVAGKPPRIIKKQVPPQVLISKAGYSGELLQLRYI